MEQELNKEQLQKQVLEHQKILWKKLGFPYQGQDDDKEGIRKHKRMVDEKLSAKFIEMEKSLDRATLGCKPSKIVAESYGNILDAYIPKEKQQEILDFLDKYRKFSYSRGYYRRTVRTEREWCFYGSDLNLLFTKCYHMTFYGKTMEAYYENIDLRMKVEELLGSYSDVNMRDCGEVIAAELDAANTKLAQTLEDILMSDNNTNIVTRDIIEGIVKSDNNHLYKILGDFLLAAKLQEGVRQVVCETMDEGTPEAFLTLLQIIVDNNLVRFSSVKRAVATWTGICDVDNKDHIERITNKMLEIMARALVDKEYVQTLLQSNDSIELYMGLWAQGFYEVYDSIASCQKLIQEGTKNQKLVVAYYNKALQRPTYASKVANCMLETYPEDVELCAAFLATYMPNRDGLMYDALWGKENRRSYYYGNDRPYMYEPVSCQIYFEHEEQARNHFELLKQLKAAVPKKGKVFSPCIFPWYSVTIQPCEIVANMAFIAYMLQDDALIDESCKMLAEMETYVRYRMVCLLLHDPKTEVQRFSLLEALGDKSSDARGEAFKLISNLELNKNDYAEIQKCLKYKASDIRNNALSLLEKQEDEDLKNTIEELLVNKKEEVRLGGLDLVVRLKKDEKRQSLYKECQSALAKMENVSEKESVILQELIGTSQADSVLSEEGYGLYHPNVDWNLPEVEWEAKFVSKLLMGNKGLFNSAKKQLHKIIEKLDALYTENENREYTAGNGEEYLLGNRFYMTDYSLDRGHIDSYPFPEIWKGFYEEHIKDFSTLWNLKLLLICNESYPTAKARMEWFRKIAETVYGKDRIAYELPECKHMQHVDTIIGLLYSSYEREPENVKFMTRAAYSILAQIMEFPKEESIHMLIDMRVKEKQSPFYAMESEWFQFIVDWAKYFRINEEFDEMFLKCHKVNEFYGNNAMSLSIYHYVKAYQRNLISLDNVYQAVFDLIGLEKFYEQMAPVMKGQVQQRIQGMERYFQEGFHSLNEYMQFNYELSCFAQLDGGIENNSVFKTATEIYWNITNMILKVELKRSEIETEFSYVIPKISKVQGTETLLDILTALGKDTLDKGVFYSWYSKRDKKTCLCHLLYVSEPALDESGETLRELIKGRRIQDKRLVEVAMYNSRWIDNIEEYLGWQGMKSGIYYFTAHMNERFSDKTEAMIAKYTPLTSEELQNGAFDLNWFKECSGKLGEERFQLLYDSAKYIAEGNRHTRARKYADAAQGKVSREQLEETICDKRNKDLLMSYALLPMNGEEDVLHTYQFLQKFLKESKQFGAQRRASEAMAVSMGLRNLATSSGYEDTTRLTLNMETKLVENMKPYFEWQTAEDVQLKISISEEGKPEIRCEKNGKALKNVPAALKKNELVVEIKELCSQLKDQYVRTKAMMEQFMEDGVEFSFSELQNLLKNPVIAQILKKLVYISGEKSGFLEELNLEQQQKLRIAHPLDLWKLGNWQDYQKILFERKVKQPFKQVFRELYVKTTEEMDKENSLRYAGNQIQPRKTVACLKSRRWVADYEDGLQKVYYKENIVARIYALADWFSPSEIEEPTLEWVEFSDRKTFQPIKIKDVPERIFSEVMRDVDLAVSVAHVGGVDPETSHSTMEMRRMIVEFNLPLFGLTNVTFSGNHAMIEGKRASYTVHLGSGVVFKKGGAQIAVLPVHSQHRGKLFLPFIDEDPKTAEIMSKIVLFAEDMKIKDPYILEQLR